MGIKNKFIVISLILSAALLIATKYIVDYKFSRLESKPIYSGPFKVWAHRGYCRNSQQNSIESFTKAFDLGAVGTELDIFYNLKTENYIVSHDYPYRLKNGRLLTLEEVFSCCSRGYFWLDFKNLKNLSIDEAERATYHLHALLEKYNILKKVIIESVDPVNLSIVSKSNLYTSYWIRPDENSNFFKFWSLVYLYKIFYLFGDFSALSMNHLYYSNNVDKIFSNVPIHLFTVNNKERLMDLINKRSVKVILSDEYFYLE